MIHFKWFSINEVIFWRPFDRIHRTHFLVCPPGPGDQWVNPEPWWFWVILCVYAKQQTTAIINKEHDSLGLQARKTNPTNTAFESAFMCDDPARPLVYTDCISLPLLCFSTILCHTCLETILEAAKHINLHNSRLIFFFVNEVALWIHDMKHVYLRRHNCL